VQVAREANILLNRDRGTLGVSRQAAWEGWREIDEEVKATH
jgi:hypothetical protein